MRKLTLTVHVLDVAPAVGTEYSYLPYPRDGLFLLPSGIVVCRSNSLVTPVTTIPSFLFKEYVEPEPVAPIAPVVVGISEATLLKALALAQRPDLAVELCK